MDVVILVKAQLLLIRYAETLDSKCSRYSRDLIETVDYRLIETVDSRLNRNSRFLAK